MKKILRYKVGLKKAVMVSSAPWNNDEFVLGYPRPADPSLGCLLRGQGLGDSFFRNCKGDIPPCETIIDNAEDFLLKLETIRTDPSYKEYEDIAALIPIDMKGWDFDPTVLKGLNVKMDWDHLKPLVGKGFGMHFIKRERVDKLMLKMHLIL